MNNINLVNFNNNKIYDNLQKTIEDNKINNNDTLSVEIIFQ